MHNNPPPPHPIQLPDSSSRSETNASLPNPGCFNKLSWNTIRLKLWIRNSLAHQTRMKLGKIWTTQKILMDYNKNLKWPSMQSWQCPIYNVTLETIRSYIWKILSGFFYRLRSLNSENPCIFFCRRNAQVTFVKKQDLKMSRIRGTIVILALQYWKYAISLLINLWNTSKLNYHWMVDLKKMDKKLQQTKKIWWKKISKTNNKFLSLI